MGLRQEPQSVVLAQFVIPAKAGIQILCFHCAMDAHFRGHDIFFLKLGQHPIRDSRGSGAADDASTTVMPLEQRKAGEEENVLYCIYFA
jgi:hypothetical protein